MIHVIVVIPTYNEKINIVRLINEIKELYYNGDISISFLIVDDNSPDGTAQVVKEMASNDPKIYLIQRPGKLGLGSAYMDAFKQILNNKKNSFDIIIQMDADFSHPPQLIKNMVNLITTDEAEVVIGSRYLKGGSSKNWPMYRKIISKGANIIANLILNTKIKDVTSGYRAFKSTALRQLSFVDIHSKGYEYQIESLYRLSKMNIKIKELPFLFNDRIDGKSKLSWKDIQEFLKIVVNMKLNAVIHKYDLLEKH